MAGVELLELPHEILAELTVRCDLLIEFGVADAHHPVDRHRYLPHTETGLEDDVRCDHVVAEVELAALLSPAATKVTLKNALTSYSTVAESTEYRWPLALLVPGVLERFDLPDCYRALAAKGLRQIDPVGAAG